MLCDLYLISYKEFQYVIEKHLSLHHNIKYIMGREYIYFVCIKRMHMTHSIIITRQIYMIPPFTIRPRRNDRVQFCTRSIIMTQPWKKNYKNKLIYFIQVLFFLNVSSKGERNSV